MSDAARALHQPSSRVRRAPSSPCPTWARGLHRPSSRVRRGTRAGCTGPAPLSDARLAPVSDVARGAQQVSLEACRLHRAQLPMSDAAPSGEPFRRAPAAIRGAVPERPARQSRRHFRAPRAAIRGAVPVASCASNFGTVPEGPGAISGALLEGPARPIAAPFRRALRGQSRRPSGGPCAWVLLRPKWTDQRSELERVCFARASESPMCPFDLVWVKKPRPQVRASWAPWPHGSTHQRGSAWVLSNGYN